MVFNNGRMVLDMKDNGRMIKPTEKEKLHILVVILTKEIGKMIKLMVLDCM
jgi:hypothetical protein